MHPFPPVEAIAQLDENGAEAASKAAPYERVPTDPARGYASGASPYRVLVSATDAFCGRGVRSHKRGLLGRLAHELANVTGHGIDVEVARPSTASPAQAINDIHANVHASTDAVIVELEPQLLLTRQIVEIGAELRSLTEAIRGRTHLVLLVQAPVPAEAATRLDRLLARFSSPVHLHLLPPRGASARATYAHWARGLARELAAPLRFPKHWVSTGDELDDQARDRAVERLSVLEAVWTDLLTPAVQQARARYKTQDAAVTIIDGSTVRHAPAVGRVPTSITRTETFCDVTLTMSGGLVVGDARADARFRRLPAVEAGSIRYYAGYRIRDARGVPVGTVFVADDQPRPASHADLKSLRDIAAGIERIIAAPPL